MGPKCYIHTVKALAEADAAITTVAKDEDWEEDATEFTLFQENVIKEAVTTRISEVPEGTIQHPLDDGRIVTVCLSCLIEHLYGVAS